MFRGPFPESTIVKLNKSDVLGFRRVCVAEMVGRTYLEFCDTSLRENTGDRDDTSCWVDIEEEAAASTCKDGVNYLVLKQHGINHDQ